MLLLVRLTRVDILWRELLLRRCGGRCTSGDRLSGASILSGLGVGANGVGPETLVVVRGLAEFIATAISKVLGGSKAVNNKSEQFPYQGSISLISLGNAIKGR